MGGSAKPGSQVKAWFAVGFLLLVLAGCSATALVLWTNPINGAAYLLGYGDRVTVHVTKSSSGSSYSRMSEAGQGYYLRDGERVPVRAYGVREGDVTQARTLLIPVGVGVGPFVYVERSDAVRDATFGLFGAGFMSLFPGLTIWGVIRARRRGATRAA